MLEGIENLRGSLFLNPLHFKGRRLRCRIERNEEIIKESIKTQDSGYRQMRRKSYVSFDGRSRYD